MRKYRVTITETLELAVCVMAESRDEAERKARDRWKDRPYILGADNFTGVVFGFRQRNHAAEPADGYQGGN